jgi:hypothetical protein
VSGGDAGATKSPGAPAGNAEKSAEAASNNAGAVRDGVTVGGVWQSGNGDCRGVRWERISSKHATPRCCATKTRPAIGHGNGSNGCRKQRGGRGGRGETAFESRFRGHSEWGWLGNQRWGCVEVRSSGR